MGRTPLLHLHLQLQLKLHRLPFRSHLLASAAQIESAFQNFSHLKIISSREGFLCFFFSPDNQRGGDRPMVRWSGAERGKCSEFRLQAAKHFSRSAALENTKNKVPTAINQNLISKSDADDEADDEAKKLN